MTGSFNKIDHLGGSMGRQRVMGETRPGQDVGRHFAHKTALPFGSRREQGNDQVLERYHPDAELHYFDIRQLRDLGSRFRGNRCSLGAGGPGASFVVPSRKRPLQLP